MQTILAPNPICAIFKWDDDLTTLLQTNKKQQKGTIPQHNIYIGTEYLVVSGSKFQ